MTEAQLPLLFANQPGLERWYQTLDEGDARTIIVRLEAEQDLTLVKKRRLGVSLPLSHFPAFLVLRLGLLPTKQGLKSVQHRNKQLPICCIEDIQ